ncbi:MAG: hypothetical protein ACYDCN_09010 [Bacteroidia bacterium]
MKTIKQSIVALIFNSAFLMLNSPNAEAQSTPDSLQQSTRFNKFAIGYNLTQYQNEFGIGLNFTSPYIAHHSMAFRLTGTVQWLQATVVDPVPGPTVYMATWSPYAAFRLSVVSRNFIITNKISIYSEGGVVMLLPNPSFSSKSTQFGGFGVLGFEFHLSPRWTQFIEAGGIGTGAVADKAIGKPIYCNGFLLNVGFRVYL